MAALEGDAPILSLEEQAQAHRDAVAVQTGGAINFEGMGGSIALNVPTLQAGGSLIVPQLQEGAGLADIWRHIKKFVGRGHDVVRHVAPIVIKAAPVVKDIYEAATDTSPQTNVSRQKSVLDRLARYGAA